MSPSDSLSSSTATDTPIASSPITFAELGVAPELVAVLLSQGIIAPFAVQELTIADALAGRDVCGKAKTGSGKTLAFGVPLLQRTKATRDAQGPQAGKSS